MKETGQKLLQDFQVSTNASRIATKMEELCASEPVYARFQFQPAEFLWTQGSDDVGNGRDFNGTGDSAGKFVDLNAEIE